MVWPAKELQVTNRKEQRADILIDQGYMPCDTIGKQPNDHPLFEVHS
jgi:hypothetical protein